MGEVRVLESGDGFEPEIGFTTTEGRELTLRLDFARCRNLKALTKIDVLAGNWSWSDVPLELWPKALQIMSVGALSEAEAEQILHPRNASILVRRWNDLWRAFAAPTADQLDELVRVLSGFTGFTEAPEDVQKALEVVVEWLLRMTERRPEAEPDPLATGAPTG
jgi:hypothetical protein